MSSSGVAPSLNNSAAFGRRITAMGSMSDKAKGVANEVAGNVRQVAGKAIGNTEMQVRGLAQEKKGEAQQAVGKAKDAVKDIVDKA
jgi:uncharacterized protein YjbJ (UPF0337 family)